jgi:hypothetical protein
MEPRDIRMKHYRVRAMLRDKTAIEIRAVLEYKACDDKICFNSQSLQLSWTVGLRTLDRERTKK